MSGLKQPPIRKVKIRIESFSYKHGSMPPDPARVAIFDCRRMRNPHLTPHLQPLSGTHPDVQFFVREDPAASGMISMALAAVMEGKDVAFGCVGGRHRSVAMAEILAAIVKLKRFTPLVLHRQLSKDA